MTQRHWTFWIAAVLAVGLIADMARARIPVPDDKAPSGLPLGDDLPEHTQAMLRRALKDRLAVERRQVMVEIEDNVLYELKDIDAARKILYDNPTNTQNDNIDRICRAIAAADSDFAGPWRLYHEAVTLQAQGQAKQASALLDEAFNALKPRLYSRERTYLSAARHMLLGRILAAAGRGWEATDAYAHIAVNMPDRISFASAAVLETARAFDGMGRGSYALETYMYFMKTYRLTLEANEQKKVADRVAQLRQLYADPVASIRRLMVESQALLAGGDSGPDTQARQEQIALVLTDLIKVIEEARIVDPDKKPPKKDPPPPGPGGGQDPRGPKVPSPAGGGKGGAKPGQPADKPRSTATGPAPRSYLPNVRTGRIEAIAEERSGVQERGGWAELPPRDRIQLRELIQQALSERHQDALRAYARALARVEDR